MFVFTSNTLSAAMKTGCIFILCGLVSIGVYSNNVPTFNRSAQPFAVFADFLYWHASEETSSSWAYVPQLPDITAPNVYFVGVLVLEPALNFRQTI